MDRVSKKESFDNREYLTCPFYLSRCIEPRQGKNRCSVCNATVEIDDRGECMFADTENFRLSVNGVVCGSCGLVQSGERKSCPYYGIRINTAVH